ncbi:hypothetical protein FRACYDRAFT_257155 [Fragilariopsis cylindrus CCMP1102]|uniref:Uncharacterized protein n=1 Tax=Fragilariopsis cylindrus CCMP1102 TaxID=635003 RepID=A0A1E7EJB1_9STRA|nr:hypothetical protein FRACYDRAFT_257155 [Fragilariopsis cylindrus CCMP1102]|eukprot:OEU05975.1 hypothetical protein FRACYDRAFT_257155 [Fragilariopsis cylindrus CCMP1102]
MHHQYRPNNLERLYGAHHYTYGYKVQLLLRALGRLGRCQSVLSPKKGHLGPKTVIHDSSKSYGLRLTAAAAVSNTERTNTATCAVSVLSSISSTEEKNQSSSSSSSSSLSSYRIDMVANHNNNSKSLLKGSPLQEGDIIETINNSRNILDFLGTTTTTGGDYYLKSSAFQNGQSVTFVVERNSSSSSVQQQQEQQQENEVEEEEEEGEGEENEEGDVDKNDNGERNNIDDCSAIVRAFCDIVLSINGISTVCDFDDTTSISVEEANKLLLLGSDDNDSTVVDIIALNPRKLKQQQQQQQQYNRNKDQNHKLWRRTMKTKKQLLKRTGVAIGGSVMIGAGLVIHPFGSILMISGVSILGKEFETPNRIITDVRNSVERWTNTTTSSNIDDDILTTTTTSESLMTNRMKRFSLRYVVPFLDKMAGDRRNTNDNNRNNNNSNNNNEVVFGGDIEAVRMVNNTPKTIAPTTVAAASFIDQQQQQQRDDNNNVYEKEVQQQKHDLDEYSSTTTKRV